jgi:tetratricopeptide (TPR) repeat protein
MSFLRPALLLLLALTLAACRAPQPVHSPSDANPPSGGAYRLDDSGQWVARTPADDPEAGAGADTATILRARAELADNKPAQSRRILDRWIKDNAHTESHLLPRAYLLRGDAILAAGNEFKALYDYETVIKDFPGSPEYAKAVERELEIGIRYLHGLRRKFFGMRIGSATDMGEELLVRVQERMPGSHLAERAGIELADYYYRTRDMAAASEAYEIFILNHPNSIHANRARQRRIYANIARFNGPSYDATGLTEARVLIDEYAMLDPIGAQREGLTDAMIARIDESAAIQQLEKARWYLQRGDPVSARYILRRIVESHPRTVSADTAMEMLESRGWAQGNGR